MSHGGRLGCCFTFRAAFFAGAGLGLAVRFVAFADFATFRALPRLAELLFAVWLGFVPLIP
jgi:hypothetical protein